MKNKKTLIIIFIGLFLIGLLTGILTSYLTRSKQGQEEMEKITETEALTIGVSMYDKLSDFFNDFPEQENSSINKDDVYETYFYKHDNFEKEFYTIFSKNIKLNDVFNEYLKDTKTYNHNFSCDSDEVDNMCYKNYSYVKINDDFYIDSICRSEGIETTASELKLEKIEDEKITYSYKLYIPKDSYSTVGEDFSLEEYNNYYENLPVRTLEIVKENDTWKINKASITARCKLPININY